jgi:hypothetical protein
MAETTTTWRDYRTCSPKQRLALDFLTRQGYFKNDEHRTRNLLYGGAGWGGKSHLLRTASYEILDVLRGLGFPNMWLTLYTNTYPNLADRHIRKYQDELGPFGRIRDSNIRGLHFEFNAEGLGGVYLRNVQDSNGNAKGKTKRGAESIGALIDESTELTYDQFTGILYTIRPDQNNVPFIPVCCTTNPDGPGHSWNKKIFHPKYRDLEHPFFRSSSPDSVFFIQALKQDNPAYALQKDVIDGRMSMIEDEDVRRARDEGAWDLYASGRFQMWKDKVHLFDEEELLEKFGIPTNMDFGEFLFYCHDFGFTAYTSLDYGTSIDSLSSYQLHLVDPHGNVWTVDRLAMSGMMLEQQSERIVEWEGQRLQRPPARRYCDPALLGRASEDQTKIRRIDRFRSLGVAMVPGINDRVSGASTVEWMLGYRRDPNNPDAVLRPPRWRISRSRCKAIGDMIQSLPRDAHNPEDVDPQGGANHDYDSSRYFLHTRFGASRVSADSLRMPTVHEFLSGLSQREEENEWGKLLT